MLATIQKVVMPKRGTHGNEQESYLYSLSCFFFVPIYALVKGSATVVSIEASPTFPSADNDNTMLGFGWFRHGFTLQDSLTTCSFDSVFPVSGSIVLNNGQLRLTEDLIFRNDTNFSSLGTVVGNGHILHLCPSISSLPPNGGIFDSVTVFCDADLDIVSTVTFRGKCSFCGVGNVITLKDDGALYIDEDAALEFRDMEIRGIAGENISCLSDTSCVTLDSTNWVQSESFSWKNGSILFKDFVHMMGTSTFSYSSSQTSTIDENSEWRVGDGMHLCMGRDPITANDPIYFENTSSKLHLDNCTIISTTHGIMLTRGTLALERLVNIDAMGTTTDTGVILGDGTPENDITVWVSPGAALSHNSGYWVYNNYRNDRLVASAQSSRMIRALGSKIYMPQNFQIKDITVQLKSNLVAPIEVETGKSLTYDGARVRLPDIKFDISAQQLNAYTYALNGNQSLFLTKGVLPLYLLVNNAGNTIRGNGGFAGAITMADANAQLTAGLNGYIGNSLVLNEGTFILDYDLLFHGDGNIVGPGIIDIKKNHLTIDSGFKATTPIYWKSDRGVLNLHGKVTLSSTWTFDGKCTIKGNTTKLVLADGGAIVVEKGSQLSFKNMLILGLSDNNIRCVDNDGVVNYLQSNVEMEGDCSFDTGSMKFFLDNTLSGAYTFSYDSEMTSTIRSDAKLTIKDGATFTIGKNNGNDPISFEDQTATLKLEDCTLRVKDTGMQLTKGTIISARDVEVDVLSTDTATGLIFGDGTADNDMKLVMFPGVTSRFTQGAVTYDITDPEAIVSKINTSYMVRSAGSTFYLRQNLGLKNLTVDVNALSQLTIDPGVTLTYSNASIINGNDKFSFTGTYYNFYTMLMSGAENGSVNLVNGTFPLFLLVMGTGNRIDGAGNLGGLVALADANAELITNFNGTIFMSPLLNGGSLKIQKDINLANGIVINGKGTVDISTCNVNLGQSNSTWATDINWIGAGGAIGMHATVDLKGTWTINGTVEIKGNGHSLRLLSGGAICIAPESTLCFRGVVLEDIAGNDIYCMDDDSVLILDNSTWGQFCSVNYTFTKGAMQFKNKATMHGNIDFIYESTQTSTICSDSRLKLDNGFTFSYDAPTSNQLELEDETSTLMLHNSTLHITTTGLLLTKGNLHVKGDAHIFVESREIENDIGKVIDELNEGLRIGDGTSSNDCAVTIDLGSSLKLENGSIIYNNVLPSSFSAINTLAHIYLDDQTKLVLKQDLDVGLGYVLVQPSSIIEKESGVTLTGSIIVNEHDA